MGKSTISMAVSNSYVSLPEGISGETLSRILLFSTETILWSNMAAGKSTRDFPPIGNPNIATRLQYFPWSNFVVVFIPILCSKFLKKSLPKMGLPPVIIHCNGIFHHKPSSYWGISYIYIYPILWKPGLKCDGKNRLLALFPFLAFHGFGRRLPGIPVSWFLQPNCLSCCANCIKLPYQVPSNSWFFLFLIQFMIFLCKHLWLMIAGPLNLLQKRFLFIQTDRSIWPQVHEHKGVKQEKTYPLVI